MTLPTHLPAWPRLQALAAAPQPHLRDVLAGEPARAERMTLRAAGLTLDSSRQRSTPDIEQALLALAEQAGVAAQRDAMFRGDPINTTEGRPVLHVALRGDPLHTGPWGATVQAEVQRELARVCDFAEALRAGAVQGHSGEAITDVVNIGIGGSDLGPRMAADALAHLAHPGVRVHYVSNPDAWALWSVLRGLDAARTLLVVSSKTFTTQETLTNAASAQRWLTDHGCPADALAKHLVAITASPAQAAKLGYPPARTFLFWDWVGGRYSVWSAIGLPVSIAVGSDNFERFLAGAHAMDRHFATAPLGANMPVVMALLGVWYRNAFGFSTHAVLPYDQRLARFPAYLQQLDMESNGKGVTVDGKPVPRATGPIVWGEPGTNGQHAFYQLIHQGTDVIPADFLVAAVPHEHLSDHHAKLVSNAFAQTEALMRGKTLDEASDELRKAGKSDAEIAALAPHKVFPGNRPTNTLLYRTLDPETLGALIALYEHKVFVQGTIWNINSYDQWGVELGKELATRLLPVLKGEAEPAAEQDASTRGLVQAFKALSA